MVFVATTLIDAACKQYGVAHGAAKLEESLTRCLIAECGNAVIAQIRLSLYQFKTGGPVLELEYTRLLSLYKKSC